MRRILTAALTGFAAIAASASASAQGLIRDTEIEAVMREYADPLIEASGLSPDQVSMYLIGDNSFNAFVPGGQNIFMHTGAIIIADRPNEIKGVIAHEIGHIDGAHLARSQEAARGAMGTALVAIGLGIAAALAGEGGAGAALMASGPQFATLDLLTYSRAQEAAADQAAVNYLNATGQSAEGLLATFQRFRYQEVLSNSRRLPYFRSHPLSSDRIEALRQRVEASPYAHAADSEAEIAELRRIQAKIIGFMIAPVQTFQRYPESDLSIPARYARAVAHFKDGRIERARAEINALLELEPDNPFFHELAGQMLYESGFVAESIPFHARSVELMPEAPLLRINLAAALIAEGGEANYRQARDHLRFALTAEPYNAFGWFQMSLAHQGLGDQSMAELATAERHYAIGARLEAYQFAIRARDDLERGSPAWIRASEIAAIAQPTPEEIRQARQQSQGRSPRLNEDSLRPYSLNTHTP